MTIAEFEAAEAGAFAGPLLALWWEGRGEWERAHEVAQEVETPEGAWVHAYLHRREGDAVNARYWYRRRGDQRRRGICGRNGRGWWRSCFGGVDGRWGLALGRAAPSFRDGAAKGWRAGFGAVVSG